MEKLWLKVILCARNRGEGRTGESLVAGQTTKIIVDLIIWLKDRPSNFMVEGQTTKIIVQEKLSG